MFVNEKDKKEFIFFVVLIIIINFISIINYFNGFFISDELTMIHWQQTQKNFFLDFTLIYYRPIPMFIIGLFYSIFGLNPIPYHLLTVLMNSVNTILFLIISRKLFKNKLIGYFATIIFIIFYGICFEVLLWIAVYFDLFFIFFALLSLFFFIRYYQEEKNKILNFLIAGLLINIAYICKETALFIVPIFVVFDFLIEENFKNFVKKIWRYLVFIPIPAIILLNYFNSSTRTLYTIWNYLGMGMLAILLLPILLKLRKIDNNNLKLTYLLLYFSCFPLMVAPTSRIWYFTALGLSLFISQMLFKNVKYSFFEFLQRIRSFNYTKKRKISLLLLISLISSSLTLYIFANLSYTWASSSTYNVSSTIININTTGKTVYLVNVPYNPLVWAMHEDHIQTSVLVMSGKIININFIFIDDQNKLLFQGQAEYGAELVSIDKYNNLTQNSSNIMFLYDLPTFSLRNVSFVNYANW
ncbi:MAG: hypothetical protein EAX96_18030 [Candidatus Lokiarchaeota archaeon]|nr:hypothetical protein [Candidatus Lokiarchaeota archaeon]